MKAAILLAMDGSPDYAAFSSSLDRPEPPPGIAAELQAMWWVKRGDWDRAHLIVQDLSSRAAAHVHAHLHRVEGDLDNARYWYGQAGAEPSQASIADEWQTLTESLIAQASADSALR